MTRRSRWTVISAAIAVAAVAMAVAAANQGRLLLPDLRPATPSALAVSTVIDEVGGTSFRLGFRAAIENVGDGPLVLEGRRTGSEATMAVTQIITRSSGRSASRPVAGGELHYERGPDHAHWHYQAAIVYRLYHGDGRLARAGTKTGFCLGDRYRLSAPRSPTSPSSPQYTGYCGRNQPQLTSLRQGISVGHGDDYPGFLEGQSLDLTDLPAGTYLLVHETDPDGLLAEADRGNNRAAVSLTLTWPHGSLRPPTVSVAGR